MKVKPNREEVEPLQYYVLKDGSDDQNYMVFFGKCFLCAAFLLIIVLGGWNVLAEKQVVAMGDFTEVDVGVAENDITKEVDVGSSTCPKVQVNIDYPGNDLNAGGMYGRVRGHLPNAAACRDACMKLDRCVGYTFVKSEPSHRDNCAVKSSWVEGSRTSRFCCDSQKLDRSCVTKGCLPIEVNSKSWGSEIRWKITTHQNKATNCVGKSGYPNHSKNKQSCCLPDDKYWLHCEDTYGDGWHDGSISLAGVNYCSNFKRGKFHKPVFWIKNGRVSKTEPTSCAAYNRHECCGKKDQRPSYRGDTCVPHKNGRFPTFYSHFGFPGNECEPSSWVNRNNFQGQKGQC